LMRLRGRTGPAGSWRRLTGRLRRATSRRCAQPVDATLESADETPRSISGLQAVPARERGLARDCAPPGGAQTVRAGTTAFQAAEAAERSGMRVLLREAMIGGRVDDGTDDLGRRNLVRRD